MERGLGKVTLGCCGHPSAYDSTVLAQSTAAAIREHMGWD